MWPAAAALTWPVGVAQGAAACQAQSRDQAHNRHYIPSWPGAAASSDDFWPAELALARPPQALGALAELRDCFL